MVDALKAVAFRFRFLILMPTECHMLKPVSLFLFAHQDDEFGVLHQIENDLTRGHKVVCAYLTSGVPMNGNPARRNLESANVLMDLGVDAQDTLFVGEQLSIPDGLLKDHLTTAAEWLRRWIQQQSTLKEVYITAWEGGHPDHDCLHAVSVVVLNSMGTDVRVQQFPLYNSYRCIGSFFSVLTPLQANGPVRRARIPWVQRYRFLRYCLQYPSQAKSWVGLFPFVVINYLLRGYQQFQPVSVVRTQQRPHPGALYYEKRKFATWNSLSNCLVNWRKEWYGLNDDSFPSQSA